MESNDSPEIPDRLQVGDIRHPEPSFGAVDAPLTPPLTNSSWQVCQDEKS